MNVHQSLGWLGTGVMDSSMAGHLLAAGCPVTLFTRTNSKAYPVLKRGATRADAPATVAARCWTLENLAPRVLNRSFDPGFFVEHFVKDMGTALAEAERMNLQLPGLALGHGRSGTQALYLALEQMNQGGVRKAS